MSVNDLVEFRFLKYFRAIGQTGNITAACQQLHVSQPAVSEQIKNVEDALGIKLLVREKSGVSLTAEGEVLWAAAGELLNGRDELVEVLKAIQRGASSQVRLGFSCLVEGHVIETAENYIRAIFPSCEISSDVDDVERLENRVTAGELDGAFITLPVPTEADVLECIVESEELVVCMRADDPLAAEQEVPAHTLNGKLALFEYPLVHPKAYAKLLEMLTTIGVTPKVCNTTTNREHVQWLVSQGNCYALLRKSRRLLPGLTTRPIHGTKWTIDTALIAKRTAQHPAIAMLVRELKKHTAALPHLLPWKNPSQGTDALRMDGRRTRTPRQQSMPLFGARS